MTAIVLATLGSHGDVDPFVAIALALQQHGADPLMLVNPAEAGRIERRGLRVEPVGDHLDVEALLTQRPELMLSRRAAELITKEVFLPPAPAFYAATSAAIAREHAAAVISHPFCLGSSWAARAAGTPTVVAHTSPIALFAKEAVAHYPWLKRTMFGLFFSLGQRMSSGWMKETCISLGVPWHPRIYAATALEPDLLLGMWSPVFASLPSFDRPDRVLCGFPVLEDASQGIPPSVEAFLAAGDPPVACTMGTSSVHVAETFFPAAAAACHEVGQRCLLLGAATAPADLPENTLAVPFAPFGAVLPRCAALVHHGGVGTTGQAMAAGIPQVVLPLNHDQPDNASRVVALGCGVELTFARLSRGLPAALQHALAAPMMERAREVGTRLRAEAPGAETAAQAVLAVTA